MNAHERIEAAKRRAAEVRARIAQRREKRADKRATRSLPPQTPAEPVSSFDAETLTPPSSYYTFLNDLNDGVSYSLFEDPPKHPSSGYDAFQVEEDAVSAVLEATSISRRPIPPPVVVAESLNSRFQSQLDLPADTAAARLAREVAIHRIILDFVSRAKKVGQTIVEEQSLPVESRTILSLDAGGIAGGEKFIVEGIFFKFVKDSSNLYGGDEFAQKTAKHELKGLEAFFRSGVDRLRIPLFAVLDYGGFRLIATVVLPLSKGSLCYGSADAAVTVYKDEEVSSLMATACKSLNLAEHVVGDPRRRPAVSLHCCADIEGHRGSDGRIYVLDAARVFPAENPESTVCAALVPADPTVAIEEVRLPRTAPPRKEGLGVPKQDPLFRWFVARFGVDPLVVVAPVSGLCYYHLPTPSPPNSRASVLVHGAVSGDVLVSSLHHNRAPHLSRLLRPELVSRFSSPLSSDCFTWFGAADAGKHNGRARAATAWLRETVLEEFVAEMLDRFLCPMNGQHLVIMLHERGINARYLPTLRRMLPPQSNARAIFLATMVSRLMKQRLRMQLRRLGFEKGSKVTLQAVTSFFNLLFGGSGQSTAFWNSAVKALLQLKYGLYAPGPSEKATSVVFTGYVEQHPMADIRLQVPLFGLFQSVLHASSVKMSVTALRRAQSDPQQLLSQDTPFDPEKAVEGHLMRATSLRQQDSLLSAMKQSVDDSLPEELDQLKMYAKQVEEVLPGSSLLIAARLRFSERVVQRRFAGTLIGKGGPVSREDMERAARWAVESCEALAAVPSVSADIVIGCLNLLACLYELVGNSRLALDSLKRCLRLLETTYGRGVVRDVTAYKAVFQPGYSQQKCAATRDSQTLTTQYMQMNETARAALSAARGTAQYKQVAEEYHAEIKRIKEWYARERTRISHSTLSAEHAHTFKAHPFSSVLSLRILGMSLRTGESAESYTDPLLSAPQEGIPGSRRNYHEKAVEYSGHFPLPPAGAVLARYFGEEVPLGLAYSEAKTIGGCSGQQLAVRLQPVLQRMKLSLGTKWQAHITRARTASPLLRRQRVQKSLKKASGGGLGILEATLSAGDVAVSTWEAQMQHFYQPGTELEALPCFPVPAVMLSVGRRKSVTLTQPPPPPVLHQAPEPERVSRRSSLTAPVVMPVSPSRIALAPPPVPDGRSATGSDGSTVEINVTSYATIDGTTLYTVEGRVRTPGGPVLPFTVYRKFAEFKTLHSTLSAVALLPPLPNRGVFLQHSKEECSTRQISFQKMMNAIISRRELVGHRVFKEFCGLE